MQGRKLLRLFWPLLSFAVLLIPYSYVNREYLVDWLGCGCPKTDEWGNPVPFDWNANDFTMLFWGAVALGVTVAAVLISRRVLRGKKWLCILYVGGMLTASLWIAYEFTQMMLWK